MSLHYIVSHSARNEPVFNPFQIVIIVVNLQSRMIANELQIFETRLELFASVLTHLEHHSQYWSKDISCHLTGSGTSENNRRKFTLEPQA